MEMHLSFVLHVLMEFYFNIAFMINKITYAMKEKMPRRYYQVPLRKISHKVKYCLIELRHVNFCEILGLHPLVHIDLKCSGTL